MKAGIVVVGIILLVIGAGVVYFYNQSSNPQSESPTISKSKDEVRIEDTKSANNSIGSYQEYSESAFDASNTKTRVLFFFANWCSTCKPIDAELNAASTKIPENLAIFRVNYNDSDTDEADKALAQKYGITYQHTFVQVDEEGNEITKWNGGGLEKLISSVK